MTYEEHIKESSERFARLQEAMEMFSTQDIERIAAQAWNATKPDTDPAFYHPNHTIDHRNLLTSAVRDIVQTGTASNARLQAFEEKVLAIVGEIKNPKTPYEVPAPEEKKAEAPKPFDATGEVLESTTVEPEPEEAEFPKGKLPDDFPGRSALADAGINTFTQLAKAGDVTSIPGIGEVTAGKISEAIEAAKPTVVEPTGNS